MKFGRIIPFERDRHQDLKELLPWYVTGKLEPEETARVQAHLAGCAECQADVAFQRRLAPEVAALPVDAEVGWDRMRRRIQSAETAPLRAGAAAIGRRATSGWGPWMGWAMAATLLIAAMVMRAPDPGGARYHALSSADKASPGNVMVMFKPETRLSDVQALLTAGDARLVDGPTAAGAYVLRAPLAARPALLARLRASGKVAAAEPIDQAGAQ